MVIKIGNLDLFIIIIGSCRMKTGYDRADGGSIYPNMTFDKSVDEK